MDKRRGFVLIEGLIVLAVMLLLLAIGITAFVHFLIYPLGWLGWLATVACLTFATMFAFWFFAMQGPIPRRLPRQTPRYDPLLSESDIAAIKAALQATPRADKAILQMRVLEDGNVEVKTGFIAGPRSGGGQYVILSRPDWKVLSFHLWRS